MNTNQYGMITVTESNVYAHIEQMSNQCWMVVCPSTRHTFFATNTERKAKNYLQKLLKSVNAI